MSRVSERCSGIAAMRFGVSGAYFFVTFSFWK